MKLACATSTLLVLLLSGCRSGATAATHAPTPLDLRPGIDRIEQGDLDGGIAALRAELDTTAGDASSRAEAHRWIGHALTRRGDPEGALAEYRAALESCPSDPWLHYACGVAWYTLGELDLARAAFTRGVECDPRHIKSLQWRALILRDLGDDRAAVEDLTRALECIESAGEATLASWGGDRRMLLMKTLNLRLQAFDELGLHEAAARDRERLAALLEGG